jgi:hypothetical protein
VEIITDNQQKKHGLDIIMKHYGKMDENVYEESQVKAVVILKLTIESVVCKQLGDWS